MQEKVDVLVKNLHSDSKLFFGNTQFLIKKILLSIKYNINFNLL